MLLKDVADGIIPRRLRIERSRLGVDPESIQVPVSFLQSPSTTIHKFAARALLGDLERGESYIHLGPDAPERGSADEANRVKWEGESLGCKWSLVSKWTSFVAVQEDIEGLQDQDEGDQDERLGGIDLHHLRGPQHVAHLIRNDGDKSGQNSDVDNDESDISFSLNDYD